jgi:hypothetical protein
MGLENTSQCHLHQIYSKYGDIRKEWDGQSRACSTNEKING